jgi:alkyldihydroxyacetonephosphate synthase
MPRNGAEVAAVLEWCDSSGAVCVPFGGGTSVVGGVNPPDDGRPVVTLQLRALDRVLEVDPTSRAALIQAGATGPGLERQLEPSGLTLRFYPQSFEFSTLGGWIATRAGGHYATQLTHIDDLVESITAITPTGTWASARLPASGAGPSPDRMLLGSEGTLGVITEAWVRLQARPEHRAAAGVEFASLPEAATAVRLLAQSGLAPAGCRVLDAAEAQLNGVNDGGTAVLLLSFESAWRPVTADLQQGLALCRDAGGTPRDTGDPAGAAAAWRGAFFAAPYLRDALISCGVLAETFETATTWDRFPALHDDVIRATQAAVDEVCGQGIVTCRLTHAYPDGVAPYFTVIAPAAPGSEVAQWAQIKGAAGAAILDAGGTITHHHAVGRDHRPWYDRQRPDAFATALRAAKQALDPRGLLNPGVLLD